MNRGSDSILSVYSDARAEYTKQLCVFLVPAYFQFFINLLESAKKTMLNEPKRVLWQFQNYLNEIHDWNMEKVHNEIHTINTNCGCDYLDDLLTAVFIAHTKILTAIRLSSNKKKVEINVPKVEHFLFKVLCESSKLLWSSTYLFRDGISGIEKQQNYRNIEQVLNEGILQAIRSLVPVKSILKDFVSNDINEETDSDDENNEKAKEIHDTKETIDTKDTNAITESKETNDAKKVKQLKETLNDIVIPFQVSVPEQSSVMKSLPTPENVTTAEINTIEHPHIEIISDNMVIKTKDSKPTENIQPIIVIDEKPTVQFGEFDAVFDLDNPMNSDMIFEPKDDNVPALEISDECGIPLSEEFDFDSLNDKPESESIDFDILE